MDTNHPATHRTLHAVAAAQGLYIGGAWRSATGGATIPVLDPSTERVLTTVPDATLEDAAAAVEAAAKAASGWAATAPRVRSESMR